MISNNQSVRCNTMLICTCEGKLLRQAPYTNHHIQTIRNKEQNYRTKASMRNALYELLGIEEGTFQTRCVQFRILQTKFVRDILLKYTQCQDWQRCIEQIVHRNVERIKDRLCTESTKQCIPNMTQCECYILIEKVFQKLAHSVI